MHWCSHVCCRRRMQQRLLPLLMGGSLVLLAIEALQLALLRGRDEPQNSSSDVGQLTAAPIVAFFAPPPQSKGRGMKERITDAEAYDRDAKPPNSAAHKAGFKENVEIAKLWAYVRILEAKIQVLSGDFDPIWPPPPRSCASYPRQVPVKPYGTHSRMLTKFGSMKKMAVLADKRWAPELMRTFKCPKLNFIPRLATFDLSNISRLDVGQLPSSFVIKAAHVAGGMVIVTAGKVTKIVTVVWTNTFKPPLHEGDVPTNDAFRSLFSKWLHEKYNGCKEPHYAFIAPSAIVQPLVSGSSLDDYKFFVVMGKARFATIVVRPAGEKPRRAYVWRDFSRMNVTAKFSGGYGPPLSRAEVNDMKPSAAVWKDLVETADCIGSGVYKYAGARMVRVDLYFNDGKVVFGETTMSPFGGRGEFDDPKMDWYIGKAFEDPLYSPSEETDVGGYAMT